MALLTFSCKRKEEHIVVFGQIYDNEQNIPLQNVKVVLSGKKIESGTWSNAYSNLGSTISDAQGNYSIDIENIKVSDFKIELSKDNYFQHFAEYKTDEISKGDNVFNFRLHSKAFIKLFIKNTSAFNNQDLFTYKIANFQNNCFECCTDSSFTYTGQNIDIIKKCSTYGAYNLIINYSVKKNNVLKEYSDSILTIPFDTINHYINY
ncbi:MAG: hypothetical protein A2046_12000 [Bacteroidetes bacterium GWA2_30_7]|nr:MAG: hypothetical protein A2046_12000 [Bacteroidetes bacterium GWA2_30_7]